MTAQTAEFELPFEIRWALTREVVKRAHAKVAQAPAAARRRVVLETIRQCLGDPAKVASNRPNTFQQLQAELQAIRLIGDFMRSQSKEAGLASNLLKRLAKPVNKAVSGLMPTIRKQVPAALGYGSLGAAGGIAGTALSMPYNVQYQNVPNGPDWSESVESAMANIRDELHRRQAAAAARMVSSRDPDESLRMIAGMMQSLKTSQSPESKEAGLGRVLMGGAKLLGRGLTNPVGSMAAGTLLGHGLSSRKEIEAGGSEIGGRLYNAYNSLFNPSAVQTRTSQPIPGKATGQMMAARPDVGTPPSPGNYNPLTADFNTMTMQKYMQHRAALAQRLAEMDKAYPGFSGQPTFTIAQPAAAAAKPGGVSKHYYGIPG